MRGSSLRPGRHTGFEDCSHNSQITQTKNGHGGAETERRETRSKNDSLTAEVVSRKPKPVLSFSFLRVAASSSPRVCLSCQRNPQIVSYAGMRTPGIRRVITR